LALGNYHADSRAKDYFQKARVSETLTSKGIQRRTTFFGTRICQKSRKLTRMTGRLSDVHFWDFVSVVAGIRPMVVPSEVEESHACKSFTLSKIQE